MTFPQIRVFRTAGNFVHRLVTISSLFSLVGAFLVVAFPVASQAADMDCGDFATQAQAQKFFLNNGGPSSDLHRLDYDGDGVACESDPCQCDYNISGGSTGHRYHHHQAAGKGHEGR